MDWVGHKVGPYEIVRRVSVPEAGDWWAGRSEDGTDHVLVRFADPARPEDPAALVAQRERLAGIDDPRLPEVVWADHPGGALVLRGGRGATLADAIALRAAAQVALTPGTLVDLLLEVAGAIGAVHQAGQVHGHLAPRSVVLEGNGAVWLYGVGADEPPEPGFTAPEVARGQPATARTDQWSVGALALALVLGQPPWRSDDPRAQAAVGDVSRAIEGVARQWPALGHVLARMTASDPAARFAALDQAADALAELASLAGPTEREALAQALGRMHSGYGSDRDEGGGAPTAVPTTDAADPSSEAWDDSLDDTADRVGDGIEAQGAGWLQGDLRAVDPDADDPEVRPELTDPIGWFQTPTPGMSSSGGPTAGVSRPWESLTDPRAEPVLPPIHEISLAADPPVPAPSPTANLMIVRLAPMLALAMVAMLVVWLVVQMT